MDGPAERDDARVTTRMKKGGLAAAQVYTPRGRNLGSGRPTNSAGPRVHEFNVVISSSWMRRFVNDSL